MRKSKVLGKCAYDKNSSPLTGRDAVGLLDGATGDWAAGKQYGVEDFKHWVWIYAVDENAKTIDGVVCSWVGYTGNTIYRGENAEYWPQQFILSEGKKLAPIFRGLPELLLLQIK